MSDSLRDRIAAAIYRSTCTRYDDYPWEQAADYIKAVYGKQADAVIAELNLAAPCAGNGCRVNYVAQRHTEIAGRLEAKLEDG